MAGTTEPTIKSVQFEHPPKDHVFTGNGNVRVMAQMSDGSTQKVLYFYDDELSISESELVGLTIEQACELKRKKDVAYLQS